MNAVRRGEQASRLLAAGRLARRNRVDIVVPDGEARRLAEAGGTPALLNADLCPCS